MDIWRNLWEGVGNREKMGSAEGRNASFFPCREWNIPCRNLSKS